MTAAKSHSESILSDLRKQFGDGKYLLSPKELAPILNKSTRAQANMRAAGNFPLPVVKVGKKVGVSMHDLADFLAGGTVSKKKVGSEPSTAAVISAKSPNYRRGSRDWLLAFEQSVMYQHELLDHLRDLRLREIASETPAQPRKRNRKTV
jgi:hypothetical protein